MLLLLWLMLSLFYLYSCGFCFPFKVHLVGDNIGNSYYQHRIRTFDWLHYSSIFACSSAWKVSNTFIFFVGIRQKRKFFIFCKYSQRPKLLVLGQVRNTEIYMDLSNFKVFHFFNFPVN